MMRIPRQRREQIVLLRCLWAGRVVGASPRNTGGFFDDRSSGLLEFSDESRRRHRRDLDVAGGGGGVFERTAAGEVRGRQPCQPERDEPVLPGEGAVRDRPGAGPAWGAAEGGNGQGNGGLGR